MVVYEFYFHDERRGDKLIGILPERRKSPERVNQESIMNWARIVFTRMVETGNVFFIRVKLEKDGYGSYFSMPDRRS